MGPPDEAVDGDGSGPLNAIVGWWNPLRWVIPGLSSAALLGLLPGVLSGLSGIFKKFSGFVLFNLSRLSPWKIFQYLFRKKEGGDAAGETSSESSGNSGNGDPSQTVPLIETAAVEGEDGPAETATLFVDSEESHRADALAYARVLAEMGKVFEAFRIIPDAPACHFHLLTSESKPANMRQFLSKIQKVLRGYRCVFALNLVPGNRVAADEFAPRHLL